MNRVSLLLLCLSCMAADLPALYEKRRLFDLRDQVVRNEGTPFIRSVVACSFNDEPSCLREAHALLDSRPPVEVAIKTLDLLFDFHFARGQWKEALAAVEAQVELRGESEDPGNMREMCRALLRFEPFRVERSAFTRLHVLYKNAHVPISVNGHKYHAYVDTGANISVVTKSAAEALGLRVEAARFRFGGAAGNEMPLTEVAVADRFVIGEIVLRNVPFVVLADDRQPFAGWGKGKRCVLGLQVLLAARNMAWTGSGIGATFELARPASARDLQAANFCFDGKTPLAAADYQGRRLTVFVDTGAGQTVMRTAFAEAAPNLVATAPRRTLYFDGMDGDASVTAAMLKELTLRVGGIDVRFRNIPVYLKGHGSDEYDGMFGNDLAGKAREFAIDFEAMLLTLR